MNNETRPELVEGEPKLLFKVTLMRHEKPFYKNEGHDLTPEGVEGAIKTGKLIKSEGRISENDEVFLMHSPAPRAKGTLGFVAQNAGLEGRPVTEINQLRESDKPQWGELLKIFEEGGKDTEKFAEAHYKNPTFEERPDIIEPRSNRKERLYRALEYLIRWFDKHPLEGKTPHIIAVSHFEVITNIINDVFGIENMKGYNSPNFGEIVYIEAYDSGVGDKVMLKVTYNEHSKEVFFDRENRSIEII
jgi:broad specificity phosphatase PhoE